MTYCAVIDFETTGLSPTTGDRATEVAVVMVEGGRVVDRFQSLMNAGVRVPGFITGLTGISNEMVAAAPPAHVVMADAARFVGSAPMAAHNASFDQRFWRAELACSDALGSAAASAPFACTLLLSRRLYPQASSHRLGDMAKLHRIAASGRAHRALADAEVAAQLLLCIGRDLRERFQLEAPDHALLMRLQKTAATGIGRVIERFGRTPGRQESPSPQV